MSWRVGALDLDHPLLLAPMEDVSDLPFRVICRRLGGVFTLVLRRLDDGWRIVHDHTSSGVSPREGEP